MSAGLLSQPAVASAVAVAEAATARPGTERRPRLSAWRLEDLRRLVRALALSGTGLVVAWLVASGTTDPARQAHAVAGGVVMTALALAGLSGWLLAGMRAVRVERDVAVGVVRVLLAARAGAPDGVTSAEALVTAPRMTHYHRADCVMARGKPVRALRGTRRRVLAPCPVCRPAETP